MIELRRCESCDTIGDHLLADERVACINCGAVGASEELGGCGLAECPRDPTHMVVYNPVRDDRRTEVYCETHAELAAEEAKNDPAGELYLGPQELE